MPDVLLDNPSKIIPSLSSTSDMPTLTKPVEEPKPSDTVTQPTPEQPKQEAQEPRPETPKTEVTPPEPITSEPKQESRRPSINERFSELTAQRRAADERANTAVEAANRATEALNKALSAIEQLSGKNAQAVTQKVEDTDPRPERAKFDAPESYDAALTEWAVRQGTRAAFAKVEEDRLKQETANKKKADEDKATKEREANEETSRKILNEWVEKRTKTLEKYPDYVEVAESEDVPINNMVAHSLFASDVGPEIAYYLGKNIEEAKRLVKIENPVKLAIEIGKIEAKITAPPPKAEPSRLPKPITPLASRASAVEKTIYDVGNESGDKAMNEYAKRRNAQLAEEKASRYGTPRKT